MAEEITEEELLTRIKGELTDALGYSDTISEQREKAMEYTMPYPSVMKWRVALSL